MSLIPNLLLTVIQVGVAFGSILLIFKMYSEVLKVMALTKKDKEEAKPQTIEKLQMKFEKEANADVPYCGRCGEILIRDRGDLTGFKPCACRKRS